MNNYESIIIFYPDTEEDVRNSVIERLNDIIETNGEILEVNDWGDRKFAYEIEYHNHGFYNYTKFNADPSIIEEYGRIARIQESVLRYMVVKIED